MLRPGASSDRIIPVKQMKPSCLKKTGYQIDTTSPPPLSKSSTIIPHTSYLNDMGIQGQFGPTLIGGLISAMLYGVTTLQTFSYYMHYSDEDASTTKFVVAVMWMLDTLHISFACYMLYYYLIVNYDDMMSLEYINWSLPAAILVNSFAIAIAQCFFAYKIYYLCRRQLRWLVAVPIILLALARVGFGIATAAVILVNNAVSFAVHTRFYTQTLLASVVVLAEVLITVSLCVLLHGSGLRSTFPRTKRLLHTLIIYAVNRCLLTLPLAIAEVVVDVEAIATWTTVMEFIVGKLYVNSLLASLNTRQYLRSQRSGPESDRCMNAVYFVNPPKFSQDTGSSKDEVKRFNERKVASIDITTEPGFDKTTMLQREAEV